VIDLGPFGIVFFVAWVAATGLWIVSIVEVARIPSEQFRAAGTQKTSWVLVVVLAGVIGGLIWWLVKREEIAAAPGPSALPPAG
jgi:cell division protein FtsX